MRAPLLLAALAFAPGLLAAPPSSTPGSTPLVPAPVGTDAATSPLPAGVRVATDLRSEYLTGFPLLVTVTVYNDGATTVKVPDLYSRPHLVHFRLDGPRGRSDRYTTPPAIDSDAEWSVPPGGSRRALIEVPSSAGFVSGAWTVGVRLALPGGNIDIPARPITLAPAAPVGGSFVWEPTIAANTGAMMPWLHRAAQGFDLYLLRSRPKAPQDIAAQYFLAHLTAAAEPILSRARPADAQSRHVYWTSGPHDIVVAKLDGPSLQSPPRTLSLPWPSVEPLGRGATDGRGGLTIPLWIPAPSGTAGEVRALRIDERGTLSFRAVARCSRRPQIVATAIDAASNLLVAMTDDTGVALYLVDASAPAEVPARGARVWKREGDWAARLLTFDTLPDTTGHAGGLALMVLLTQTTAGSPTRILWSDVTGRVFTDDPGATWDLPGTVISTLSNGYGPLYALTRDAAGATWYAPLGGTRAPAPASGTLWPTDDAVMLRTATAASVFKDYTLGTQSP